jgi:hypothetical protein
MNGFFASLLRGVSEIVIRTDSVSHVKEKIVKLFFIASEGRYCST